MIGSRSSAATSCIKRPAKAPNELLSQFKHTKKSKILTIHSKLGLPPKDSKSYNLDPFHGKRRGMKPRALYPTTTPRFLTSQPRSSARSPRTVRAMNPDDRYQPRGSRRPGRCSTSGSGARGSGGGHEPEGGPAGGGGGAGPDHVTSPPALRPSSPPARPAAAPGVPCTLCRPPPAPPSSRPSATEPEPQLPPPPQPPQPRALW